MSLSINDIFYLFTVFFKFVSFYSFLAIILLGLNLNESYLYRILLFLDFGCLSTISDFYFCYESRKDVCKIISNAEDAIKSLRLLLKVENDFCFLNFFKAIFNLYYELLTTFS